ncbi:MAG: trigger factor [bacterium]
MNVEIKELPKSMVEITISVPYEKFETYITQATQKLSKDINIKGFRPGKAPRNMVEEKVGLEAILQEAADLAVPKIYTQAVIDKKIPIIGQPKIEVKEVGEKKPFTFKAEVALLPKLNLPDLNKIKIKKEKIEVSDEDVDKAIKELQKSRAKQITTKEAAKVGDRLEIDFKAFKDKVPVDQGEGKNHPIVIGDKQFIPGFEDNLVGLKEKDEKTFEITFPQEYHAKHLAGAKIEFKVKVNLVQNVELPELNDEFASSLGEFKTFAELKNKIKENLVKEKEQSEKTRIENEVIEKIADTTKETELPEVLIHHEQHKMLDELKQSVQMQGGQYEKYLETIKKTEKELEEEMKDRAELRARASIILRQIAEEKNFEVEEKELQAELDKAKEQYKFNPDLAKQIESAEYKDYTRGLLRNKKVFQYLVNETTK